MGTVPTVLVAEDCRGGGAEVEDDESAVLVVFMAALILNYLFVYLYICCGRRYCLKRDKEIDSAGGRLYYSQNLASRDVSEVNSDVRSIDQLMGRNKEFYILIVFLEG